MSELNDRFKVVAELTKMYRPERFTYLGISIISFLILITSVIVVLIDSSDRSVVLVSMFGSSGVVTLASGRSLYMWKESMSRLFKSDSGDNRNE